MNLFLRLFRLRLLQTVLRPSRLENSATKNSFSDILERCQLSVVMRELQSTRIVVRPEGVLTSVAAHPQPPQTDDYCSVWDILFSEMLR